MQFEKMRQLILSTPVLCSILGYLLVYGLVVVCLFRPNKYGVRRRWLALDYVWVVLGILTGIGLVMLWFMQHQRG